MLISLQFTPSLLKDEEKLQTVNEIESFTKMAHNDAMILFVSAKVKNFIVTLTKDVTKEEFMYMDKNPTKCITIDEVGMTKNRLEKNDLYEAEIDCLKEKLSVLQEQIDNHPNKNNDVIEKLSKENKHLEDLIADLYNQLEEKEKTNSKSQPITTNIFEEPIVMLHITKYSQLKQKLKEYEASSEENEKYKGLYKDLYGSLENTLKQFK